jgi:hypothetical protein
MKLTNTAYNMLNVLVQIILPSAGTLYFTLAGIWGLPNSEKVVGSIVAIDTFLGLIQAWFKKNYKPETSGTILLDDSNPAARSMKMQLDAPLEDIVPGKIFVLGIERENQAPPHKV